jgi:enediyne biosynthesis protein E4
LELRRGAQLNKLRRLQPSVLSRFLSLISCRKSQVKYKTFGWTLYLLNGSTSAGMKGQEAPPRAILLHNNHDGTFTDLTEKAGVANKRWGFGVAISDYDNDGWPDTYVANYGKNRLYHNNHDGTFTDVAEKAGVALGGWSTSPT